MYNNGQQVSPKNHMGGDEKLIVQGVWLDRKMRGNVQMERMREKADRGVDESS